MLHEMDTQVMDRAGVLLLFLQKMISIPLACNFVGAFVILNKYLDIRASISLLKL